MNGLVQNLIVVQLVKKIPSFLGTRRFITVLDLRFWHQNPKQYLHCSQMFKILSPVMRLILLVINFSEPFALGNPQCWFLEYSICLICHHCYTIKLLIVRTSLNYPRTLPHCPFLQQHRSDWF
jgi:hypothetical protein